ncbi:MAG: trypsin-like peptidase domain-containing protein [Gaiellales bacterium]
MTRALVAGLVALVLAVAAVVVQTATSATTAIGSGVVVIETRLAYQGGEAAGTGMVLTSSGEILTNNHVIRGATTITVIVPGTSRRYKARVLGYDVPRDVALLQVNASNLKTVELGNSSGVKVGQAVKAIGNAGGTGSLTSSTGTVTALGRSITVSDGRGGTARLTGLIETSADLESGDSGGPLFDASGNVVGMNTAATITRGPREISDGDGYAIPINRAASIVDRIESGEGSATVHVGATAFIGVTVRSSGYDDSQTGAVVLEVVQGGPADRAGIAPGSVITAFAGRPIRSAAALTTAVMNRKPGEKAAVTYVDPDGTTHRTTITLGDGPPQ